MQSLAILGLVLTVLGLGGLGYCILQGLRIRGGALPADQVHARLHRLVAVNLASVGIAALGLAMLVAGVLL
jgi:hypothetical protein